MTPGNVKTICAVATGGMGAGTALVFAIAGYDVRLYGRTNLSLAEGADNIEKALKDLTTHSLVSRAHVPKIMGHIQMTTDLETSAMGADLVVESIREDLQDKKAIFAKLDKLCPPHTIFGTNTSSLSPTTIAEAVSDKRKPLLLGLHLFKPPHLMSLVEVVAGHHTSQQTMDTAFAIMKDIGKDPVRLNREIPGYIVNRVQAAMWQSSYTLLEHGHSADEIDRTVQETLGKHLLTTGILNCPDFTGPGSEIANPIRTAMRQAASGLCAFGIALPEDVDRAVGLTLGLRLPVTGPIVSSELTGLDTVKKILESLREDLFDDAPIPSPLEAAVAKGHWGKKTGQGIHAYSAAEWDAIEAQRASALVVTLQQGELGTPSASRPPGAVVAAERLVRGEKTFVPL